MVDTAHRVCRVFQGGVPTKLVDSWHAEIGDQELFAARREEPLELPPHHMVG